MTDDQVRTAIAVLRAYAHEELSLDNDILDELDDAIEAAFAAKVGPEIDFPEDYSDGFEVV